MMPDPQREGSSFRDPSGHVFREDGVLLRSVEATYAKHYDRLMSSGLYEDLTGRGLLVAHEEVAHPRVEGGRSYRVLRPSPVPFVSYPWEWSFSQLRDAALLTLDVAWAALEHDMVLKDATAFNVQFTGTHPVFIDTLSFETYTEGQAWQAYQQFCRHFLAPLELHALVSPALGRVQREYLDGVPLDLAARLLPRSSLLRPATLLHIHLHARAQKTYADSRGGTSRATVTRRSLFALLDSLRSAVTKCRWTPEGTEWADYYDDTNYSDAAMDAKLRFVEARLAEEAPGTVWDLGANTGRFSRAASAAGAYTVAFDIDPAAVERAYLDGKARGDAMVLPLVQDLMNPTPDLGWALAERDSFVGRGRPDLLLALALVHHLAISNNVPLDDIAGLFARLAPTLIIEFVPKSDSQVVRLLSSREDIFREYTREGFERAFSRYYALERAEAVPDSDRVLYLMRRA